MVTGLLAYAAAAGTAALAEYLLRPDRRGDHTGYSRVLILAYQRSGSTMLVTALSSHPRCVCYSEVFNERTSMMWGRGLADGSRLLNQYRDRCPDRFLERLVFGGYEPGIEAVGFKAFPGHVRDARFARVLEALIAAPDVRLLHLKRWNRLAQVLSLVRAHQTGVWHDHGSAREDRTPLRIEPATCERAFREMAADERYFDRLVAGRPVLPITYEDMAREPAAWFERVQSWVGLPVHRIEALVRKQRRTVLPAAIANYDELKDRFTGTEWERYFAPGTDVA